MTGSVQQYDATCRELGTARKQLEEVIAERDRLESDLKTVFESVEGVLQEDPDDPAGMPVQDRGILKRDKGERSPKKAELAAVAAAAAARADRPRQRRVAELTASDMWARQKCISVNTSVPCAPKRVNYFKGVLTDKDLSPKCVFMSPKKEVCFGSQPRSAKHWSIVAVPSKRHLRIDTLFAHALQSSSQHYVFVHVRATRLTYACTLCRSWCRRKFTNRKTSSTNATSEGVGGSEGSLCEGLMDCRRSRESCARTSLRV